MRTVALLATAVLLLAASADAASISRISPAAGSLLGGTRVTISGTGFDIRGRSNDVFIGTASGGVNCDPVPNECHETRIVCITDPSSLKGAQPLSVTSFGFPATCEPNVKCQFTYTADETPSINGIWPQWVADPTDITVNGARFEQGDVTVASFDFSMWLGEEERCNIEGRPISWSAFQCGVNALPFAGDLPVTLQMGSAGNAENPDGLTLAVYPTIRGVEPSNGSIAGGQRITVFGSALSKDQTEVKIRVHGVPCEVVEVQTDYAVCITTAHGATQTATRAWRAGRALAHGWQNLGHSNVEQVVGSERYVAPEETAWLTQFGSYNVFGTLPRTATRVVAHFVPNATGNWTFRLFGDDETELWLGTDANPVPRTVTAVTDHDPTYARRIGHTYSYTNSYFSWPEDQSETVWLTAGEKYWMMALVSNGGGGNGFSVRVEFNNATVFDGAIPSDFITYSDDWKPPVELWARGQLARVGIPCLNWGECDFNYVDAQTPSVTSVTPSTVSSVNTPITFTGTGFSTNKPVNEVLVAGSACVVTSATTTELVCTMPNVAAGSHLPRITVAGKGLAVGSVRVVVNAAISGVTFVGASVTINGNGFGADWDRISVKLGTDNCPIQTLTNTQIICRAPASVVGGSVTASVDINGTVYTSKPFAFVFDQPFVRPGTTTAPGNARVRPQWASVWGTTMLSIDVPGWRMAKTASVSVTVGTESCAVVYSFFGRVMCRAPRSTTLGARNVTVTYDGNVRIAGTVTYREVITDVYPLSLSMNDGNRIRMSLETLPHTKSEVSIRYEGQPCTITTYMTHFIECIPSATRTASNPVLSSLSSTSTTIPSGLAATSGVRATAGSFIVPAGEFIVTRRVFDGPVVLKARIKPSAAVGCVRFGIANDGSSTQTGIHAWGGHQWWHSVDFGTVPWWGFNLQTWNPVRTPMGIADNINTKFVADVWQNWRLEIRPSVTRFYVDDVLVAEYATNQQVRGVVGLLPSCQSVEVQDIVVEDLSQRQLQVNFTNTPAANIVNDFPFDAVRDQAPVTAVSPTTAAGGDVITFRGSNFVLSWEWTNYATEIVATTSATTPYTIGNYQSLCSSTTTNVREFTMCTIDPDVPAGTYQVRYRSWYGFAATATAVTVNAKINSITPAGIPTSGAVITIGGSGFSYNNADTTVTVGGASCPILQSTPTIITCNLAASTGTNVAVVVTHKGTPVASCAGCTLTFAVDTNAPNVTVFRFNTYNNGFDGYFDIRGTNLGYGFITIGGALCQITSASNTQIWCILRQEGPVVLTGAQPFKLHVDGKGYGIGVALPTTVTLEQKTARTWPTMGSNLGGALISIAGLGFPLPTGTVAEDSDFSSASTTLGWTLSQTQQWQTCASPIGRVFGGFGTGDWAAKTLTGLPAHTHLLIRVRLALIDDWSWDRSHISVTIDGSERQFFAGRARLVPKVAGRSACGRKDANDYIYDIPYVVPHSTSSAAINITGIMSHDPTIFSFGLQRVTVTPVSSIPNSVAVGGSNCPIAYYDSALIECTTPALTTAEHTVVVTADSNALACVDRCTFNATIGAPVPSALGFSGMRRVSSTQSLEWARPSSYLSVTNGMPASIVKTTNNNGWNAGVTSAQTYSFASGFIGVEFEFAPGTAHSMFGLRTIGMDTSGDHVEIDYAIYLDNYAIRVYERGMGKMTVDDTWVPGRKMQVLIDRATGGVSYLMNNKVFYVSSQPASWPVRIDASLHNYMDGVKNIKPLFEAGAVDSTETPIVVAGTNFPASTPGMTPTVTVGGTACPSYVDSLGRIVCLLPSTFSFTIGSQHAVVVTNTAGMSASTNLVVRPLVAALSHAGGSSNGGHKVTIWGSGYAADATVTVGGVACAVTGWDFWTINCTTGALPVGSHAIVVTVNATTSACVTDVMPSNVDVRTTCPVYNVTSAWSPVVSNVAPTTIAVNSVVQITGTNFIPWTAGSGLPAPYVGIGDSGSCLVSTSTTNTSITCTVSSDIAATATSLWVSFPAVGKSNGFTVSVPFTVTSAAAQIGNLGGAQLVVTGTGFGANAADIALKDASTNNLCTSITVQSSTQFTCVTAAFTLTPSAATDIVLSVGASTLNIGLTVSSAAWLTASLGNAPVVSSVLPPTAAWGDVITITGTNLAGAYAAMVGSAQCVVLSSTATEVRCMVNGSIATSAQAVTVTTAARGLSTGSISVNGVLKLIEVSPKRGVPGAALTITASGVVAASPTMYKVDIGGWSCAVTATTTESITCTLPTPPNFVGTSLDVRVRQLSAVASVTSVFTYATPVIPTVTSVNPTLGSAAGGESVVITGTGFDASPALNTVTIGGKPCMVTAGTTTSLTCTTSPLSAPSASAAVVVSVNGAASAEAVSFNAQLAVTGLVVNGGAATAISTEGGITLTVQGNGFPVSEKKYATIQVGGLPCVITATTSTAMECTLPASTRARERRPTLLNAYAAKPQGSYNVSVWVNKTLAAIDQQTLFVTYSTAATPTITQVTSSGAFQKHGSQITVTGTGFAASGNKVRFANIGNAGATSDCNVDSESTTQIVCTLNATTFGRHFVTVWVPGKGYASTVRACGAGEFLMCDGSCLTNADCVYAEWGFYGNCQSLANLVNNDTFCHSNGGTDRINIPLLLDTSKDFNLNCPMYSCEGSDCDTVLEIGGRGGRVSTCRGDPNGFVLEVKPTIATVSAARTSSLNGGLRVTITGTNLDMKAVIRIGNAASCIPLTADGTTLTCETSASVESANLPLALWRDRVLADCPSGCTGFAFAAANTPTVTSAVELRSSRPRCVFGGSLTLVGTGFSSTLTENVFTVKGVQGTILASNATHLTVGCPAHPEGDWTASVRVVGKGLATLFRSDFRYLPTVLALSTKQTSLAGGQLLTITGSGFTSSNVTVTIGTACSMKTISVNTSVIVARTLPCVSTNSQVFVYNSGWTRSECGISPDCNMASNNGLTPIVSGVTQAANIQIAGTFLTQQQNDLSVTIGDAACSITSFASNVITCTPAATHRAGTYPILVSVNGYGYGYQAVQATKTYAGSVASVAPTSGALGGNQLVTVQGTGFGETVAAMRVEIAGIPCAVQTTNATHVTCKTGRATADATAVVNVTVMSMFDGVNNTYFQSSQTYSYLASLTPTVTSISPSAGSTAGGTRVTIAGTNLAVGQVVTVEGQTCAQDAGQQTDTTNAAGSYYYCTTGTNNLKTAETTTIVLSTPANGDGLVSGKYQYVDLWSRWTTWGNAAPPVEGDSAVIGENQTVVLDISPPELYLIIVMGHLKFDSTKDLTIDATYIMVNFGRFTIGTPEAPYTMKATIRLHGDRLTPEIPVHGSKVLAVRNGALDMHGIKRQPTWTTLSSTAAEGANTIQITGPVDWQVGEEIVIASTDYKVEHAEPRKIAAISGAATASVTITLDEPLHYEHFGSRQCFGPANQYCVDEVAEVILLTRNIVVEGDKNTHRYGFGGTMFLMPLGSDPDRHVRLSYIEMRDVGQQYIVGRYPVHFHVTHDINTSYVNGTSVHRSLNRAYSIHGTNNNTYVNNVVYDTHGHSFFIEDGSEKYNVIDNNVVIFSRSSTSNLNTDVTPANFWVVSPLNKVTNNRACGGHAYGFWIAPFHPTSTGPTYSPNICPSTHKMWMFENNTAHSNAKYGLNIFRFWWPKRFECDFNGPDEQAYIRNHLSYKNKIHGVTIAHSEVGNAGAVKLDNLTSADNGLDHPDAAAYWCERITATNMTFGLQNSLLIALTGNQPYRRSLRRRAINLPLGDNFISENITFVNYNGENFGYEPQAWAERFSFCFPWGWEAVAQGLTWVNSPNRILYRFDHHGVINDLDGSLTGQAHSQILPKTPIFDPAQCVDAPTTFNTLRPSVVCNEQYKVRRFDVSTMENIWKDQLWTIEGRTELVPEIKHQYSMVAPINKNVTIDFQHSSNPGWWEWKITPRFFQPWERMMFSTFYREPRWQVNGTFNGVTPAALTTWPRLDANVSGFYWGGVIGNSTNGSFSAIVVYPKTNLMVTASSCEPGQPCNTAPMASPPVNKSCEPYDVATSWTNTSAVPADNTRVIVTSNDAICLNRASGVYNIASLYIEGSLVLDNSHCPASGKIRINILHYIHLRGGNFLIGNATHPLTACTVEIVYGNVDFNNQGPYTLLPWGTRSLTVEAGKFMVYAPVPTQSFVRLAATANAGATTLTVDQAVSWLPGDVVVIASTQRELMFTKAPTGRTDESEKNVIVSVSGTTITLARPLVYTHVGMAAQTINGKTWNVGAEVALLSRRVTISGGHNGTAPAFGQGWNFNIGCTDKVTVGCGLANQGSAMHSRKTADIRLNGIAFVDAGQDSSFHSAIEIDGLISSVDNATAAGSYIRGCAFDTTWNTAVAVRHTTTGFELSNNVFYWTQGDGVRVISAGNNIDRNIVVAAALPTMSCHEVYKFVGSPTEVCRPGSFRINTGNNVTANVAASAVAAGFITEGDDCAATNVWRDNQAHAVRDGVLVFDNPADPQFFWPSARFQCRQIRGVLAYGCQDHGLVAWYLSGNLRVSNFTSVDNMVGLMPLLAQVNAMSGYDQYEQRFWLSDSAFWGSWPNQQCRASQKLPCRGTLLDSEPWCLTFHSQAPFMYNIGLMEAVFVTGEISGRTKGEHKFMWMEPDSYTALFGRANIARVHFDYFNGNTSCGTKSVAFYQNPFSNDTFHQHVFESINWGTHTTNNGEFWARKTYGNIVGHQTVGVQSVWLDFDNIKFGAYWPDAPNKVWLVDKDGSFTKTNGLRQILASETIVRDTIDFQNLPWNGSGFMNLDALPALRAGCTKAAGWNAYVCENIRMMSLSIEHLGDDFLTRRAAPVVLCKGNGMIGPDGKPLCQGSVIDFASGPVMKGKIQRATLDRIARWRFIAEVGGNYTLYFRGQPPAWLRMAVHQIDYLGNATTADGWPGITINLRYFGLNAEARVGVYRDGVRQISSFGRSDPWDAVPPVAWPAPTDPAGTHYHNKKVSQGFTTNVMSVVLRDNAWVDLKQEPIVLVTMQVSMPMDEFFNQRDTFAAAMANVLGIDASRMKFVDIQPGTSRRATAGGSAATNAAMEIEISRTAANAGNGSQVATNDLKALNSAIQGLSTRIGNFTLNSISSSYVGVTIAEPTIAVAEGYQYLTLNVSIPTGNSAFNATLVQESITAVALRKFASSGSPKNITTTTDVAVANVWKDANNFTRFTLNFAYDQSLSDSNTATQTLHTAIQNNETVLPNGYRLHAYSISTGTGAAAPSTAGPLVTGTTTAAPGTGGTGTAGPTTIIAIPATTSAPESEPITISSLSKTPTFIIAVVVGLIIATALTVGLLYYCIKVRPARHAEKVAASLPPTAEDHSELNDPHNDAM